MAFEADAPQLAIPSTPLEKADSLPPVQHDKIQRIVEAYNTKDLDGLILLATSKGGFLNDELRQKACTLQ
jgi:hypothetical protein